jgi:hypothetical protein
MDLELLVGMTDEQWTRIINANRTGSFYMSGFRPG